MTALRELAERVVEDRALVPKRILIEAGTWDALQYVFGGPGTGDGEEFMDCTAWVGEIENDDGSKTYGMHVQCNECPEEGSITLAEFTAAQPIAQPRAVPDANIPTALDDLQLQLIEVTEERDHLRTELAARHARGVPDAIPDGAVIFGDAEDETYRDGWNACRKAMLAAAPSPGESA